MDSRRTFIKKSLGLSAAICSYGLLGAVSSCTPARYATYRESGNDIIIDPAQMMDTPYVLVNHPELQAPVYIRKNDSGYHALLLLCTHKACDVKPAGAVLVCPCHGSEFSSQGKVLKGPAEEALHELPVRIVDNQLHVQIR